MTYNKYGNHRVEFMGHKFDSKREAMRYALLQQMEKDGKIFKLVLQPSFEILPDYVRDGLKIRGIKYFADFSYQDRDGSFIVEDVKGVETEVFKIKRKMFECQNPSIKLLIIK